MIKRITTLVPVLLLSSVVGTSQPQTLIHCGQFFDATSGDIAMEKTIFVEGDRIIEVADGYAEPAEGQRVIDLKESLVLPGLIDLHVHLEIESDKDSYLDRFIDNMNTLTLRAYAHGMKTLRAGFTTVRDLGGTGANVAYRDAVESGLVQGPRVLTCRKSIAITGGHADPTNGMRLDLQGDPDYRKGVCDGSVECARAVRWQVKQGADLIKITATGGVLSVARDGDGPAFSMEEMKSIVETANDRGVHVAAHSHGQEGMLRAVKAGVHTIEHGTFMNDEVMDAMKIHGTYYVPTITAGWAVARNAEIDDYYPDLVRPKAARIGPQIQETFTKAYKSGVKIAFGTDAGVFDHGLNYKEFELMVDGGMPMKEALLSATKTAAEVLDMEDEIGYVKAGYYADLAAFSPVILEDPTRMKEVHFVMKGGEIIVGKDR